MKPNPIKRPAEPPRVSPSRPKPPHFRYVLDYEKRFPGTVDPFMKQEVKTNGAPLSMQPGALLDHPRLSFHRLTKAKPAVLLANSTACTGTARLPAKARTTRMRSFTRNFFATSVRSTLGQDEASSFS